MIDKLEGAIKSTVEQFQNAPYDFLSERDIQAVLFAELRTATHGLRWGYDSSGANSRFGYKNTLEVHPVFTEYRSPEGIFDIAVLSEDQDPSRDIWRQPCRIAIELKLWQPCEREPAYFKDIDKLRRYQSRLQNTGRAFTGIAMLLVHPCVKKRAPTAISEERSGMAYPADGVALHLINEPGHWWKQCYTLAFPED